VRSATWARLWVALLPLLVGGCPVTDDYFIDEARGGSSGSATSGAAGASVLPGGGTSENGGAASGGSSAEAGNDTSAAGEAPATGGTPGATGGAPNANCSPTTERCNGHDDDCDEVVDEQACNSMPVGTMGCFGFVIGDRLDHGYMLCSGVTRDYARAQEACRAQGMRLAWLESDDENEAVSAKVSAIEQGVEAWIGATDQETEGSWGWDGQGGMLFWGGNEYGNPVGDAYVAWAEKTPNNSEEMSPEGEDCAVLMSSIVAWGDRSCMIKYAYLCEEPEPEP